MKRKIIQISSATVSNGEHDWIELFALCSDGTAWGRLSSGEWSQFRPIPDDTSGDEDLKKESKQ